MRALRQLAEEWAFGRLWRYGLTLLVVFGPLALVLSMQPIVDPPAYHDFADQRAFIGIPNFLDVVSSIPYLLLGIAGLSACHRMQRGSSWPAWNVFFTGIALVGAGSAWYHWNPSSDTIAWDRLPMTLGFTGLFVAILIDYMSLRLGARLLVSAVLVGLFSVVYGYGYDDLRLYAWIQALPLLAISAAVLLYRPTYTRRGHLLLAFAFYALAKAAEMHDREVFTFTAGIVSGHTMKHVLAAFAIWAMLAMVRKRMPIAGNDSAR
ncbi:MAG: ceramidase [Betaproteobacteria bacterium]|nr:ceramidase [Betaproteobacteria bacterium]